MTYLDLVLKTKVAQLSSQKCNFNFNFILIFVSYILRGVNRSYNALPISFTIFFCRIHTGADNDQMRIILDYEFGSEMEWTRIGNGQQLSDKYAHHDTPLQKI
jgi:hypothetical protein